MPGLSPAELESMRIPYYFCTVMKFPHSCFLKQPSPWILAHAAQSRSCPLGCFSSQNFAGIIRIASVFCYTRHFPPRWQGVGCDRVGELVLALVFPDAIRFEGISQRTLLQDWTIFYGFGIWPQSPFCWFWVGIWWALSSFCWPVHLKSDDRSPSIAIYNL